MERKQKKASVNIARIAQLAGVSKATVSRTINGTGPVKEETKARIDRVIQETGFIPNRNAQYLAGHSTKVIGVILGELKNSFFMEISEGIDSVLSSQGYSMQMCCTYWRSEKELKYIKTLISNHVDGVIMAASDPNSDGLKLLHDKGIPFVVINGVPDDDSIPFVSGDNYKGGKLVGRKIKASGYRKLLMMHGFNDQSMKERMRGILSEIDIPYEIETFPENATREYYDKLRSMIINESEATEGPLAVFVSNDSLAVIVESIIADILPIPEKVSIIGYDNIEFSAFCRVPLTTVSQNMFGMGSKAAGMLVDIMNGRTPVESHVFMEPELIERDSTI